MGRSQVKRDLQKKVLVSLQKIFERVSKGSTK